MSSRLYASTSEVVQGNPHGLAGLVENKPDALTDTIEAKPYELFEIVNEHASTIDGDC